MARNIIRVSATQLVVSESNPQGILSDMNGFPVTIDSNNSPYNGNIKYAMKAAKGIYFKKLGENYEDTNPNRVMTTVTLEMADGFQVLHESIGSVPAGNSKPNEESIPEEQ